MSDFTIPLIAHHETGRLAVTHDCHEKALRNPAAEYLKRDIEPVYPAPVPPRCAAMGYQMGTETLKTLHIVLADEIPWKIDYSRHIQLSMNQMMM